MDIKCGLHSKHLFQRTQEHGGPSEPLGNNKFLLKILSSSYHMKQNAFIKVIYTFGKSFFEAATFIGLWDVSPQAE